MKQDTQGWCSETTQRDGVEREVGGGIGHSWLIHVDVWQNPQYCKVVSLQLKKKMTIGVSCHFLLQGIFLTQGLNPR